MLKKIRFILQEEGLPAVPRRAMGKVLRVGRSRLEEVSARRRGSYTLAPTDGAISLTPRLGPKALESLPLEDCIPEAVAQHYLDHRFDLLGSGWTQVRYGMHCRGMAGYRYDMAEPVTTDADGQWLSGRLNPSNLTTARQIWQRVDADYVPIDWQLDFKSGYRWAESTWAARLPYGHLLGVDVKVPWELARMQHLPQMALRAVALGRKSEEAQSLVRDIRNQCLDFIATNPPGFGVNWICPMDVAIRATNWCVAWDVLQSGGSSFEPVDENLIAYSLLDHGRYIVRHLEWSPERGNHYLADICGLAFIAAYLPETLETDKWLAFAIGQLQVELIHQFLPDGGNFEGSTAYHRLSLEMVLYATALILGLPEARLQKLWGVSPRTYAYLPGSASVPKTWELHETGRGADGNHRLTPFSPVHIERLQRAVQFLDEVLKPDGTFPQIGDNDSGRFFKLQPTFTIMTVAEAKKGYLNLYGYEELPDTDAYYFEEYCQGLHIFNTAAGLGLARVEKIELHDDAQNAGVDFDLIVCMTRLLQFMPVTSSDFLSDKCYPITLSEMNCQYKAMAGSKTVKYTLPQKTTSEKFALRYIRLPFFGLHIWKAKSFYLCLRSIETEAIRSKVHFHDDQLSVELTIDGQPLLRDPGAYIYTPLPDERNRYRSRFVHFDCTKEPLTKLSPFIPIKIHAVECLYAGSDGFAGSHLTGSGLEYLTVRIYPRLIELTAGILQKAESNLECLNPHTSPSPPPYSPAYGIQERI